MNIIGINLSLTIYPSVMLPWLKRKQIGANLIAKQKPDGSIDEMSEPDGLSEAVMDLFKAYESKDVEAGARAFRSAFAILESEPHSESGEES